MMVSIYKHKQYSSQFYGRITNQDWNILAALPALTYISLIDNAFETNFSEITIAPNIKSPIKNLELGINNDFYGQMDVSIDGFFSHFPDLEIIDFERLDIEGHFDNFDIFSIDHMRNLNYLNIKNNAFTGSIALSDGLSFNSDFYRFHVDQNNFSGEVDWSIFDGLHKLQSLHLHGNALSGTIDWNIMADLGINGVLNQLYLSTNQFIGYVDFSWMTDTGNLQIWLDITVPCMYIFCITKTSSNRD